MGKIGRFEEDSLVDSVIDSIKNNITDYCYTRKDLKAIIEACKKLNLTIVYEIELNKSLNTVDYIEIIPCKIYDRYTKQEVYGQFNRDEIPDNFKYTSLCMKRSYNIAYGVKQETKKRICNPKEAWKNFNLEGTIVL